jgi:2-haloacid dehalogenase
MSLKIEAVAFDVIETLFSLEALRPRFRQAGLPEHALERWFAELLRDAFALEVSGVFKTFREIAREGLRRLNTATASGASPDKLENVIAGFAELDAHPDVRPALERLAQANIRLVTLTNGSADTTQLLKRADAEHLIERTISIDDVRHWKPSSDVYRFCAKNLALEPAQIALVAAHGWDVLGAQRVGMMAAYVERSSKPLPAWIEPGSVVVSTDLGQIADAFVMRG